MLKTELQQQNLDNQVSLLESKLKDANNRGERSYRIPLEEGIDFHLQMKFWILPTYNLVGYGRAMWDEAVRLGFTPSFCIGGGWAGGPSIRIRW